MKQRHTLSLLQTGYTTVNVMFPASQHNQDAPHSRRPPRLSKQPWENVQQPAWGDQTAPKPAQSFVYKTRDFELAPGDRVIVERLNTPSGLAIGIVVSLDATPQIDVDADFDYKWIVQRVDMAAYNATVEAEQQFENSLQEVNRAHERELLVAKMTEHLPANSEARKLFDAAVASLASQTGHQTAIAAPVAPAAQPSTQTAYEPFAPATVEQPVHGVKCK